MEANYYYFSSLINEEFELMRHQITFPRCLQNKYIVDSRFRMQESIEDLILLIVRKHEGFNLIHKCSSDGKDRPFEGHF